MAVSNNGERIVGTYAKQRRQLMTIRVSVDHLLEMLDLTARLLGTMSEMNGEYSMIACIPFDPAQGDQVSEIRN
jgi:hypothetical protein